MSRRRRITGPNKKVKPHDIFAYKELPPDVELSEADERRIIKLKANEDQERKKWASKLTTRYDVVQIVELFMANKVMPMAQRLDACEMYIQFLERPFYVRWWTRVVAVWLKFKKRVVFLGKPGEDERGGADGVGTEGESGAGAAGPAQDPDPGDDDVPRLAT